MTARQVASLALKLFGIYLLIQFFPQVPYFFIFLLKNSLNDQIFSSITTFYAYFTIVVIYTFLCVYLIFKSDWLAEVMVDEKRDLPIIPNVSGQDIQAIAFSVFGVVLLASAIRLALGNIVAFGYADLRPSHQIMEIVSLIVRTTLGIALFLQAKGLARFWHTLRS